MKKTAIGILSFVGGCILGGYEIAKLYERAMEIEERLIVKNEMNFKISYKWLKGYKNNSKITDYFNNKEINEIAIYGMGELGRFLLKELENTEISVKYVIDRNSYRAFGTYTCYSPSEDLQDVQAVIVTPVSDYENIAKQLRKKINASLIPLNEVTDQL